MKHCSTVSSFSRLFSYTFQKEHQKFNSIAFAAAMIQKNVTPFVAKFNQTQLPDLLFGGFSHQKCTRRIPPEGNPRGSTCKGIRTFVEIAGCKVVIVVNLLEATSQFCRMNQTDREKETVYVQKGNSFSFINSYYHSAKHHTRVIMYKDLQVKNQNMLNFGVIISSFSRLV